MQSACELLPVRYAPRVRDLAEQVEQTIQDRQLLRPGQPVLVAVSGGLDSMVLLAVLQRLSARQGWQLAVAHLNHQLRGRSSEADARLVQRTAERLGLPVLIESADIRRFARSHKLSLEMAARKVRHDFLARTAAQIECPTVALAHHADDQLELFFLRLLRGSGGQGLAGMNWRSPSPSSPAIELVRPLLEVPKAVLRDYAAERNIRFREDASNASLEFQRNRIRHELLPLLRRKYQPALDKALLRLMEIVGAEAEFVGQAARGWLAQVRNAECGVRILERGAGQGGAAAFEELPVAVQRRALQLQLLELGVAPEFELIEELRRTSGRPIAIPQFSAAGPRPSPPKLCGSGRKSAPSSDEQAPPHFPPGAAVQRDARGVLHFQPQQATGFRAGSQEIDLHRRAECGFAGKKFAWHIEAICPPGRPKRVEGCESFDAETVGPRIVLRHWQVGDRFQPSGMKVSVKLQDIFTNLKIPRSRRHELVVAATAQGELFWVEGVRISERFKLTNNSRQRLVWKWQPL